MVEQNYTGLVIFQTDHWFGKVAWFKYNLTMALLLVFFPSAYNLKIKIWLLSIMRISKSQIYLSYIMFKLLLCLRYLILKYTIYLYFFHTFQIKKIQTNLYFPTKNLIFLGAFISTTKTQTFKISEFCLLNTSHLWHIYSKILQQPNNQKSVSK